MPWNEIVFLCLALLAGGVLTGLLAGMFGVGGGGVMVPVLYEVFRAVGVEESLRMQLCIGTSLAVIIPTSYMSYRAHAARGAVLPGVLRTWRLPAIAGMLTGTAIAAVVDGWVLKAIFVGLVGALGLKSVMGRNDIRIADHLPGKTVLRVIGYVLGLAASLVGISGGGVATNILLLYRVPIHAAVATSAGIGMIIPIPGVVGYAVAGWPHLADLPPLSLGYVSMIGFICMAPLSMVFAPMGARIAHRLPHRKLEIGIGLFFLAIAARFFLSLVWR